MATNAMNLGSMIETRLQYDGERQKILAQNVASQGIPGYKSKDLVPLDFTNVLASEVRKVDIKVTAKGHFTGTKPHTQRFLTQNNNDPFEVKPTGDNSTTEEQMMKVAENAADYQKSSNLYKKIGNLFKEALGLQPS